MPSFKFAIIDPNIFVCLGLQRLLGDLLPMAEVTVFHSALGLTDEDMDEYRHFFVASRVFFEHATFFRQWPKKTIVLVNGDMLISDIHTLNVCQDEKAIVRDFMNLQNVGHGYAMEEARKMKPSNDNQLSPREKDVAIELCRGLINKEIADKLNISITTVITHRKNIMAKLHFRSLADLIIYCLVNGIVNIEEL